MKKEKKPLTPTEKVRLFTVLKWATFGSEFVAIILPLVIVALVNYKQYFVEYSGVKMSIAGVLSMLVMGFTLFIVTSKKIKDFYIPLIIIVGVLTLVFFLLGQIINELAKIMLIEFIGLCFAFGLDITSKKFDKEVKDIKEAIAEAEKELTKQAYMEEKTIKEQPVTEDNGEEKKKVIIKVKR